MPKLSKYIGSSAETRPAGEEVSLIYREDVAPNDILSGPSAATQLSSSGSRPHPDPRPVESRDRLQTSWERRAQAYGPRQYRQPDGSVSVSRPPRNPYAVASRASWRELVRYCRQETTTSPAMLAVQQLRYGDGGGSYDEHVAYLKTLGGMSSEIDEDGGLVGYDEARTRPLEDEGHAFRSYYRAESAAVFEKHSRRRS